mmetsp:Transcript_32255/g.75093  ORF Transcript_32255/g.75093 Transcript_32255/m.75093 type:complete len:220 (+) Transcript_32255:821-1480(+)
MSEHRKLGTHSFCSRASKSASRHWFSMKQRTAFTVRAWRFLSPPLLCAFCRKAAWSGWFAASLARRRNSLHMSSHQGVATSRTLPPFMTLRIFCLASARLGTPAATISSSMASRLWTYLRRCVQEKEGSFFSQSCRYSVGWQLAKSRSIQRPRQMAPRTRFGRCCMDDGLSANHLPIESEEAPFLYETVSSDLPCDSLRSLPTASLCSTGILRTCPWRR